MRRSVCLLSLMAVTLVAHSAQIHVPERDPEAMVRGERSAQLKTVESQSPWLRKLEHDGIVYLLYAFPAMLKRYSLESRTWLPDIELKAVPRGLAVSSAGIIVNQNTEVTRYELSGAAATTIPAAWVNADDIGIAGDFLLTSRDRMIQSLRLSDNAQVAIYESFGGYDSPLRFHVATGTNVIYGWQSGLSPSDILRIPVYPNGMFGLAGTSPYHGDFPASTVIYPSPDGSILVDPSGVGYSALDLSYLSGVGGPFDDIAFGAQSILTLASTKATLIDRSFQELGVCRISAPGHGIAMRDDHAFVFRQVAAPGNVVVDILPLGHCGREAVGTPGNPIVVPFQADSSGLADDGILYLFNRAQRVVHRFSIPQWRYLESAPLPREPMFAAVGRSGSNVFIAYEGGRLGVLRSGQTLESFLAYGPLDALGLAAAGDHVMTVDHTGAWNSHRVYDLAGRETDWVDWNYPSREFDWNPVTRRMYHFRDDTSPNDLHFEVISLDGVIIQRDESPYHGEIQPDPPIRSTPNGSRVYLGSGQVLDGIDLNLIGQLSPAPSDLAWLSGTMYSMHPVEGAMTRINRWSHAHAITASGEVIGTPGRLFAYGSELISVTLVDGRTLIQRWPASLSAANLMTAVSAPATVHAPGQPVSFVVETTNGGMVTIPAAEVTATLSTPLPDLKWSCDTPSGVVACGDANGLTVSVALAPGQSLRASAYASMHADTHADVLITATATSPTNEVQTEDNTTTGVIRGTGLFADGFEQN